MQDITAQSITSMEETDTSSSSSPPPSPSSLSRSSSPSPPPSPPCSSGSSMFKRNVQSLVDSMDGTMDDMTSHLQLMTDKATEKMDRLLERAHEKAESAERYIKHKWENWNPIHFNHLPDWMKDNDFLWTGHRPQLDSYYACFKSIFRLHTETANIWTHLIGCVIFLSLLVYVMMVGPFHTVTLRVQDKLVFGTFLISAVICLGMSTCYHTVSCHSREVGLFFSKLDYCGIATLITGSFVPFLYYGFYCESVPKTGYIVMVVTFGALTTYVSLSETFSNPHLRHLRAGVFASFGLSGIIPAVHWLLANNFTIQSDRMFYAFACLGWMALLYLTGTVFYAMRIPERFFPGKCDIWLHSHQIFHVFVLAAAMVHYKGISQLAMYRLDQDNDTCPSPILVPLVEPNSSMALERWLS